MALPASRDLQTQTEVADANGYCTFVFAPPPQAMTRTGTVCVTNSGSAVTWRLYLGGAPQGDSVPGIVLCTTLGQNVVHQVQQQANDYLVIQAAGLSPGAFTFQCSYHATVSDARTTPIVWPVSLTTATQTTITAGVVDATITGPVTVSPEAGATFDISGAVTVDGDVTVTGTVDVGTISGDVSLASGTTVDIGTVSGGIDISGPVEVENVSGGFLTTGDIPTVAIACTVNGSNEIVTTTALPQGMRCLIINPEGGEGECAVNVIGNTSNIRYAWQAPLGDYAPLVVPVDPETDTTYTISFVLNSSPGWSSSGLPIYAAAQAPQIPTPISQVGHLSLISYTGTGQEAIVAGNGSFGSGFIMLDEISWVAFGSSATSAALGHIYANEAVAGPASESIADVVATSAGMGGQISFPGGLPCVLPGVAANPTVYFAGNSSATDFANVSVTAVFHTL